MAPLTLGRQLREAGFARIAEVSQLWDLYLPAGEPKNVLKAVTKTQEEQVDKACSGLGSVLAPHRSTTHAWPEQAQDQPRFKEVGKQVGPLQ